MNKKLSRVQQDVLDKMRSGWELGRSTGINSRCWIQQGGLGEGGQSQPVSISTIWALVERGLIEGEGSFPTIRYKLKEKP